jgi:hypothetical protein
VKEMLMKRDYSKYNYKRLSVTFNLDYGPEKEMVEWLDKNKAVRCNFSDLMKTGLKMLMDSIDEPLKH